MSNITEVEAKPLEEIEKDFLDSVDMQKYGYGKKYMLSCFREYLKQYAQQVTQDKDKEIADLRQTVERLSMKLEQNDIKF